MRTTSSWSARAAARSPAPRWPPRPASRWRGREDAAARRHLGVLRRRLLAARQPGPAARRHPRLHRGRPHLPGRDARGPRPRRRSRRSSPTRRELVAELEADPALDFEWLPFPEYYDAPGRVPLGRSIQPTNIKRGRAAARGRRRWCGRRSSATAPARAAATPSAAASR